MTQNFRSLGEEYDLKLFLAQYIKSFSRLVLAPPTNPDTFQNGFHFLETLLGIIDGHGYAMDFPTKSRLLFIDDLLREVHQLAGKGQRGCEE